MRLLIYPFKKCLSYLLKIHYNESIREDSNHDEWRKLMKKKNMNLIVATFALLTGCSLNNPASTPVPTTSPTPDTIINTPSPASTVVPTATPNEEAVPTATPNSTYQPIEVTYAPTTNATASPTKTPEVINHAPVFDLTKMGSLVFQVKENGVAGDDTKYSDANQVINGKDSFSFQIIANDPDKDAISYYISEASGSSALREIETHYATVTVDVLGKVNYTLKENHEFNQNEKAIDFFMIRVVDTNGFYSEAQVTVNIEGTNSAPSISIPSTTSLSVPSQATKTVQGQLQIHDADKDAACGGWVAENYAFNLNEGNTLTISQQTFSFTIDAGGAWTLTISSEQEAKTINIPLIYKDNHGSSASVTLSFEIDKNSAPTIDLNSSYSANKEAGVKAMIDVSINANDVDGDTLSYRIKNYDSLTVQFDSGTLVLNPETKSFHFTVSDTLKVGIYEESFTLIVSDGIHDTEKEITLHINVISYTESTSEEKIENDANE